MILRRHERYRRIAVRQREERDLWPFESFLDDERPAGVADLAVHHQIVHGPARFLGGNRDDDAFAAGQAVSLQCDRAAQFVDRGVRVLGGLRDAVARGGDAGERHQVFGERLAGFEPRRVAGRAEDGEPFGGERVGEAALERRLGADDRQVHVLAPGQVHEPVHIGRRQSGGRGHPRRSRRCRVHR